MSKNTSISLGTHFDEFVQKSVSEGRFKNSSEVIRAGLRLLEKEEKRVEILKSAIKEGLESSTVENFDFEGHLKGLKNLKK